MNANEIDLALGLEQAPGAMVALTRARDLMATISGVASCSIGLEANIGPGDYPMIRLVPSRLTPGRPYSRRTIETLVYFGMPIANSEGLESVYAALFGLEQSIIEAVRTLAGRYVETLTDEDRLDAYKLMTVRCNLEG